jgi:palmitoyltransferase ZDHHC13/17
MPWYTGILLAMAEFFAMHHVCRFLVWHILQPGLCAFKSQIVTRVLLNRASYTDAVVQSPYYAGIIFASLIWAAYCWATRLIQRELFNATIFSLS